MYQINKIRANCVIDYAAQELKKYLFMMMPDNTDITITYAPEATEGFRLGLLEDFSIPFEGEDPVLDDVIHIETTECGGILAGSNPRSVLFAVYRFLRENGCRWLYPGIDGEYIPTQEIRGIQYHKLADHRFRGFCDEGSESQSCMLEAAEFYPKLELNAFFLEWFVPNGYYNRYYTHLHNEANRTPEPVDDRQVLQWRRQVEAEINKRGLILAAVGHGWTSRPFGFPDSNTTTNDFGELNFTEEQMSVVALRGGKREFFMNRPIYTNLCMSNPEVRKAFVQCVADYAQQHQNLSYLRVWLSDGSRNHCECPQCQKQRPADWYMMLLNEIDAELTKRNLPTRLTFIAYLDTFFAPQTQHLNNPQRFVMAYAPIGRDYTSSITEDTPIVEPMPYVRNGWQRSQITTERCYSLLKQWQQIWHGDIHCFEYHFWRHQFLDPGGMCFARRVYEDVRSLKVMGLCGCIEDGSQRSGFPNGFGVYVYARTLMDRDADFEELKQDYFSHIYGADWQEAVSLLEKISEAFDFAYMEGVRSKDETISPYYDPDRVTKLAAIDGLCDQEKALAQQHINMPYRPQTVSWRLLLRHSQYCRLWAAILTEKALGNNEKAKELAIAFCSDFGKYELEMERYYDHSLACRVLEHVTRKIKGIILD